MTTEPPRGIKANLRNSYSNIVTEEKYEEDLLSKHETGGRNESEQDPGARLESEHDQSEHKRVSSFVLDSISGSPKASKTTNLNVADARMSPKHMVNASGISNKSMLEQQSNVSQKDYETEKYK